MADKQTVFENCLADVNIPLGEVFTSPVLKGTEGVLNVSKVYLNDINFKNLKVHFKDGFVTDYMCDNYEDEKRCKDLFKENVLFNHNTLPIGEFAIGTNTTAYVSWRTDMILCIYFQFLLLRRWDHILHLVIRAIQGQRMLQCSILMARR